MNTTDFCPYFKDKNFDDFHQFQPENFYPWNKDKKSSKAKGGETSLKYYDIVFVDIHQEEQAICKRGKY
jgi:hypothetical protein